jgi:hypothetical protein
MGYFNIICLRRICLCKYYIWKVFVDNVFDEWHVAYDKRKYAVNPVWSTKKYLYICCQISSCGL